jgi:hypothetical protein
MMAKGKEIGDPLDNVARTGKIGGRPQPSKSVDIQTSETLNTQSAESLEVQQSNISKLQNIESPSVQQSSTSDIQNAETLKGQNMNSLAVQTSKGTHKGRTQQTIYLPPALAKKLKFAAVEEEREISEIVTDALEAYFKDKAMRGNN